MSALQIDEWQGKAACRGPHSAVFFPPPHFERKEEKLRREARARDICGSCNVKDACLRYALDIKEPHGIWGGLNESERKQLLADRAS